MAAKEYGTRWQKARAGYLRNHPDCARCPNPATVVDHIRPHRGDQELFWDRDNWQPLCKRCHDTKTAREDGGFGNKPGVELAGCGADGMPLGNGHHWNK